MKTFGASIPIGLGDLIYIKAMFDPIKHEYERINLKLHRDIIVRYEKRLDYNHFLDEFTALLFGEVPYKIDDGSSYPYFGVSEIVRGFGLTPHKPEMSNILCKGTPLDLDAPYIVMNTKIRSLSKTHLEQYVREFWNLMNSISEKYKIVILGEKVIEMTKEYQIYTEEHIFSLYPHIYNNIPADRLIDLTVPALGITSPDIKHLQQDCLIMNQAKCVINFGIGGGFCLATAVANTIGYRYDNDPIADLVFDRDYPNAVVTKDWPKFIQTLGQYL